MSLLERSWFLLASLIIAIILLVDPKSFMTSSSSNLILRGFATPSSGQKFIYRLSTLIIGIFLILTIILSSISINT